MIRAATAAAAAVLRPTGSSAMANGVDGDFAQLLGDDEAVLVVADHQRSRETLPHDALHRVLQHGPLADQREKLLGIAFPRNRPQA